MDTLRQLADVAAPLRSPPVGYATPPARGPGQPSARHSVPISAADLFRQLFPDGVQMTGELFVDLEQLLRLTSKLAAGGNGKTP